MLAVETGIPIVPIYYSGTYSIIKEGPWKMNNQKLKLIIGKPIFTEKYSFDTRRELAKKVQSEVKKKAKKAAIEKVKKDFLDQGE